MNRLLALVVKEFRQTFRDPRLVWLLVGVPVLQLTLFGYVVDLEVDRVPTAICDLDRSPASRDLAARFFADRTFVEVARARAPEEAAALLRAGQASAALVFPEGLGRRLKRGWGAEVQVLVDGTDPIRARVAGGAAEQLLGTRALEIAERRLEEAALARGVALRLARIQLEPRILYNPRLKSPVYMVPGVAAIVLMVVTMLVTAMGVAREREMGTLEQVLVTPIGRTTLVFGKILPYGLIGLLDVGLVLGAGMYLFDVPLRGSLLVVYAAAALYLLTTLGMGLFISTISRSQQQAILSGFFVMLPAILLSGFMAPVENMPEWIRPLAYADPVYYFLTILRAVMLKGAGFADCAKQFAVLAAFGVAIFTASAWRFGRRL
jgi:ABC-2 type transport system permease protein